LNITYGHVISGFRLEVDENCAFLGYHAARSVNYFLTFRDSLSVPSSRTLKMGSTLKMEPIGCLETSVNNYHYLLRDSPEERSSHVHLGVNIL